VFHPRPADLVILSDLHLGEGPGSQLEDFGADRELVSFADHLITRQRRADRKLKVVLAGDTFDFGKVAAPAGSSDEVRTTPSVARAKLRQILAGHPLVVQALGRLLAAGHQLVVLPGNHDLELGFEEVQRDLSRALAREAGRHSARGARVPVQFEPWFHLHGGVLTEHGQRYEPMTSLDWNLVPVQNAGDPRVRASATSYLLHEVVNRVKRRIGHITYLAPGPAILWEVLRKAPGETVGLGRFASRMMGRFTPAGETDEALRREHQGRLAQLAGTPALLREINAARKTLRLPSLSREDLGDVLQRFDQLTAKPYLDRQAPTQGGAVRSLIAAFRAGHVKRWLDPSLGGTLQLGQVFALTQMARVMVTGHTHYAQHYVLQGRDGEREVLNSGTWTPVLNPGDRTVDPTRSLTFVDVHLDGPRTKTLLRRWDGEHRRGVLLPAKRVAGELPPAEMAVH